MNVGRRGSLGKYTTSTSGVKHDAQLKFIALYFPGNEPIHWATE